MEYRYKILIFVMCCLLCIMSCANEQTLPPIEYVQWIKNPKNGFIQSKTVNKFEFTAQYKPLDFIVAQEERSLSLSKKILETRKKELGESYLHYNFRIKNKEGSLSPVGADAPSNQEYQKRLGYFTFDMQDDLYLLSGQDTFPCVMFQFVRNYDVTPYVEFAIGFKKKENSTINQDITFVFEDRVLGMGTIKLLFKKHVFQNTLKIKTL